ncbi:pantoate--beta-alanine ligase [Aeromicrobium sp. UC242_57]|uniref:pantoate--beta-alanine ligase n=1 Tax=Aeromicrobium sp. UC242_57 TaxID=3374624 RepID=UPI003796D832
MRHARPLAETSVVSIFVNPTQFAPGEDFDDYPRTFDADLERCAEADVDLVFAPAVPTMYPSGLVDTVTVDPGPLGAILEGAARPTDFRGVLTVVSSCWASSGQTSPCSARRTTRQHLDPADGARWLSASRSSDAPRSGRPTVSR